ncbi:cell wall hydrolase [Actinacidiphila alni]|uniref:cell wall hydrolase n=1 Tax=Actinacidiphila alni TaxID=380248 RepID=UPI0033F3602A
MALITEGPPGDPLGFLPPYLRDVPYAYDRDPVSTAPGDLAHGANCQLYAYAVLAHFGRRVPPLRSSELFAEETALRTVATASPLDLLLFAPAPTPTGYGAHVALHLAPDRILHLTEEVGRPTLWTRADFATRPRYAHLLAIKRPLGQGR